MEGCNSKEEIKADNLHTTNKKQSIFPKRNINTGVFVPLSSSEVSTLSVKKRIKFGIKNDRKKNEKVYQNSKLSNSKQNVENISKNVYLSVEKNKNVPVVEKPQKKNSEKTPKIHKKRETGKNGIFLDDLSDGMFEIENIVRNPIYLRLIEDLVNCFTSSSTQSESELANLKLALFEKTSSVFVKLLNECIDKTFNRVLNSDVIKALERKYPTKQDASCQTYSALTRMSQDKDKKNQMQ